MTRDNHGAEPRQDRRKRLDPASLKALAHPMRAELFRALQEGPATSAQLAQRMGSNTGTVSWHLRQLARFGFIEDDPGRGSGRERWWRAGASGTTLDIREDGMLDDPVALEAARWYVRDSSRVLWDRLQHWVDTAERWPEDWIGASFLSQTTLDLTAAELLALQHDLAEVVERHRREAAPGPGTRRVQLSLQAFPAGDPDA